MRHGDNHLFLCDINQDLVAFSRWELNRQPLMLDQRLFQLPSGALVVSNASDADTGLYRCVVETGGVVKSSEEAELKVIPGKAHCFFLVCLLVIIALTLAYTILAVNLWYIN